jgi:hypothetical protein
MGGLNLPPLGQSSGSIIPEILSAVEMTFLVEMLERVLLGHSPELQSKVKIVKFF